MDKNTTQSPRHPDLALAALRLKLCNMAYDLEINEYQDSCAEVIFDYTIIYMKSVIRSMARYKRNYRLVCPILTGIKEKRKTKTSRKESLVEEETLLPWQVGMDCQIVKELNINFQDANHCKDMEKNDSQKEGRNNYEATLKEILISTRDIDLDISHWRKRSTIASTTPTTAEILKSTRDIDLDILHWRKRSTTASTTSTTTPTTASTTTSTTESTTTSSKTADEDSNSAENRSNSANNKRPAEESTQKTVKKRTNEYVKSEVFYAPKKFNVRDLKILLKMESHIIPSRSVSEIYKHYLQERVPD